LLQLQFISFRVLAIQLNHRHSKLVIESD
jgi:hypothetical protein